jgi:nucleoside-diphosphate-sugar epimerase
MTKVFVFGATGFIGGNVAKKFSSEGYTVFGLTRSEEKAKELRRNEIIPVIGKAQDQSVWEKYVLESDIIVEALADYQDHTVPNKIGTFLSKISTENKNKIIIYTSGSWIYGSSTSVVSESTPVNPPLMVSYKPSLEKLYLDSGSVVLRPSLVYGKSGSLTANWFKSVNDGDVSLPGNAEIYYSFIHVDDLADAYIRVAQNPSISKGEIFNVSSYSAKVEDVFKAIMKITGHKRGISYYEPQDPFSQCLALSQQLSSQKIKIRLGWNPKKPTIIEGIAIYYSAWQSI